MKKLFFAFMVLISENSLALEKNLSKPSTEAGVTIPVNTKDIRILQRAAEILDSEVKWNRNDDRECPPTAITFSLYCALYKASLEINGEFDHRLGAMEEIRRTIEEVSKGKSYEHRLMGYNNDASTTFKNIKIVLKKTEKRIEKRLQKKFR